MKKKRICSLVMVLFLMVGFVQIPVHAETDNIQVESVILTEEDRYNPEYYQEPEVRYPAAKKAMSRTAGTQQTLEEYVVTALENFETTIDVSAYNIPLETEGEEFFKIINNNPQLFYVEGNKCSYGSRGDIITSYIVTYLYDKATALQMREKLETAAEQAVAQVDESMDDYEKALTVHDYLVQNCEYDYENYLKEPGGGQVPQISHTAYGSLVNNIAVCDGYADGFAYIMEDKLGISCDVVSSRAMAHAWNMIEIGGKWYHVDATWDDPTWDCIGRVMHTNFLLSDSKISNNSPDAKSGDNHYSWNKLHTADSTDYDNAFWADVKSAICYYNGAWYYSKYQDVGNSPTAEMIATAVKLVKKDGAQLLTGSEDVVHSTSVWLSEGGGYYPRCYMYLAQGNNNLYFNTSTEIYQVKADGSVGKFYSPQDLSGMQIYGFTVRGNEFWYAPQSNPNLTISQKQTDIRKYTLQEISGISAADVTGTYNGQPFKIEVRGTKEGDVVQYAGEDGNYQLNQPRMVNAGTYEVRYRVIRDGYAAFYGTATVTIEQAEPQYEVPTGLNGRIGDTLASVTLPEGFSWQTPETVLEGLGTKKYMAKYVPVDTDNYKTVTDIQVSVEQECPGHQYTSQITTPPTAEQNGVETYTCTICGHTYTQEIDKDLPVLTGVSAADVTRTYTGEPYTIRVTGVQEGDTVQYAVEDGAYEEEQPEMKNAGVYTVFYKVERANYRPFYGSARVEITKAVPSYTLPANCAGNSGDTLADVSLPNGFTWQQPDTALRAEGSHTYPADYTPEDTANYQVVTVQIAVTVTCPGHNYSSVVTKQPTESEEGIRTCTCTICGKSYTETIDKLLPVISGITAANVTGVYNGQPYTIEVKGTKAGDVVQYALKSDTDAQYTDAQPEMKRAGTYQVLYKVTRDGYQPFIGRVQVEITRAVPQYTVPANLKGSSGAVLSSVTLPQGFIWQTDPDTKLGKEGANKFYACYRPSDQVNYSIVTNIEIVIEVKCPGHQYGVVITAQPTETKKGLKTYTCRLCEKSYTDDIPMLVPERPAMVSGLKVAKQTDTSLSFSWKKVPDVRFRLMLYQGNKVISTKYVTENSCIYTKLKPATVYTLRVTPYRIVNGQNIYAISTGSAKTATAPAKAKLSKAQRSGKSKVKLTWKKVSGASGYEISMKTGNGKYKKIKMVGKKVSFTKTGLNKKTSYSFRIRAYVTVGGKKIYGAYSNVKKVK